MTLRSNNELLDLAEEGILEPLDEDNDDMVEAILHRQGIGLFCGRHDERAMLHVATNNNGEGVEFHFQCGQCAETTIYRIGRTANSPAVAGASGQSPEESADAKRSAFRSGLPDEAEAHSTMALSNFVEDIRAGMSGKPSFLLKFVAGNAVARSDALSGVMRNATPSQLLGVARALSETAPKRAAFLADLLREFV